MKFFILSWSCFVLGVLALAIGPFFWGWNAVAAATIFLFLWIILTGRVLEEGIRSNLAMCRRLLENPHRFTTVDAARYAPDAVAYCNRMQTELEKYGFVYAADITYSVLEENRIFTGRSFVRLMHHTDFTIWALLLKLNPPWYTRFFFTAFGMKSCFDGFVTLGIEYDNGVMLECNNLAFPLLSAKTPDCLKRIICKNASVWDLLEKTAAADREIRAADDTPNRKKIATLEDAVESIYRGEIMIAGFRLQNEFTREELLAQGFSEKVADDYLKMSERIRAQSK